MPDSDPVRTYFDRAATAFDSLYQEDRMGPVMRVVNRTFRRDIIERFVLTLDHVKAAGATSVLDVGCGSGRYALALAQAGIGRIVGVDVSPGMIDLARKAVAAAPATSRIDFLAGDFLQVPLEETFDVVVSMGVFDYIEDPVPVLARMNALARHSVVASFPSIHWLRTPIRKVRYWWKRCPLFFYEPERIRAAAARAGMPNCRVHKIAGAGQDWFVAMSR